MKTVLLSPIGGKAMPGIIEYFKAHDFRIVGIDADPDNSNRFMVGCFYEMPPVDWPSYKGTLIDILKSFKVDLFISWLDMEVRFWNEEHLHDRIPSDVQKAFAFNFRPDLNELFDKWLFSVNLMICNLLGPRTRILRGPGTWERIKFPIIFKPRIGTGSRDIRIVKTSDEYDYWSRVIYLDHKKESFIAQEYVEGDEYTVDFFADKGELVNHVIRLRLKANGVSMAGKVVFDKNITDILVRFCKEFEMDGLNNIQIIESEGRYYITELNPRPSGTIMLSVTSGVDLFQNLIERHNGLRPTRFDKPKPLQMIRYLKEFYYA